MGTELVLEILCTIKCLDRTTALFVHIDTFYSDSTDDDESAKPLYVLIALN